MRAARLTLVAGPTGQWAGQPRLASAPRAPRFGFRQRNPAPGCGRIVRRRAGEDDEKVPNGGEDTEAKEKAPEEDVVKEAAAAKKVAVDKKSVEKYKEQLEAQGIDQKLANEILRIWKEKGTENPDQLRRLFVKGSLKPLGAGGIQLVLDLACAYGAFYVGNLIGSLEQFPFQSVLSILAYSGTFYYLTSAVLDVTTLVALLFATVQFGANSGAFLDAVRELAGEPEIGVISKVKTAVNTVKVVGVLNELADVLKEKSIKSAEGTSTLQSLSAYFILSKAKEQSNFDPKDYGLSPEEADRIALCFSSADLNDDGVLELSELGKLCDTLGGTALSDEELEEAIRLLDTNRNNVIDFTEFVDFWVNKVNPPAEKSTS